MKNGLKHLIECHCIHPSFRDAKVQVYHKFVVFSIIDDDVVVPKYAQCNNCGVIHHIIDVCKSQVALGKDAIASLITVDDIKLTLSSTAVNILESYNAELPTWEEVAWIIETQKWGSQVVIKAESEGSKVEGKLLYINSPTQFKIESYSLDKSFPQR